MKTQIKTTEPMPTLVGKFFIRNKTDTYQIGVVEGEVSPGAFLVRIYWAHDSEDGLRPRAPASLVNIHSMEECAECGGGFEFFDTREELDAYMAWLDRAEPKTENGDVVKLRGPRKSEIAVGNQEPPHAPPLRLQPDIDQTPILF
jgi:hypothetical protein